ncbi:MAG: 5-formyltetrahydrofolate cyclo-ligase, partial [Bacteroidales bacterium]|nr:5-formyltetrahydrofolate cyclo-ligase [Bacteroidales bacterium]
MTDSNSYTAQRTALRFRILGLRNQLSRENRETMNEGLLERVLSLSLIRQKNRYFVYCNYQSEVATRGLIDHLLRAGKIVSVPLADPSTATMQAVVIFNPDSELVPGYKGISEPNPI